MRRTASDPLGSQSVSRPSLTKPDRPRTVLAAEALSKYYGPFVAAQNISFTIAQGEIVAMLGPNGAGKTTIMRMLTGYLAPSQGTASIAGYDVQHERLAAASHIGYLPENGPLYLDMTPLEVLKFFGEARALPAARLTERINIVATQCDIHLILDKPIGKLSKGLRQRVGMAQALLHDPDVLIMDEPTAGLDPIQIRQFRHQVRELRRQKTLLVSTHILQEVEAIADRVLVIHRGGLVFDGTLAELGQHGRLEERFCELTREDAGVGAGER